MSTTSTLDTLHSRIAEQLAPPGRPFKETTTAAGSSSSLVIAALAYTSWSANAFDGRWVYSPSVTAPKQAQVTTGGFAGSSGTFTIAPAMGSSPGSAATVYFTYGWRMSQIDEAINKILRTLLLPRYLPLTLVTDGDMETSGTTAYTAIGTATLTKVTTAGNTLLRQGLRVQGVSAADGGRSTAFNVHEGETLVISVALRCDGGKATVQLYNADTSAVISTDTYTTDEEGHVELRFTYPVGSDVERLAVQVVQNGATALDAYVSWISVLSGSREIYAPPSVLNRAKDVKGIYYLPQGLAVEDANVYVALSERLQPWPQYDPLTDYFGLTSHKLVIAPPFWGPLFVEFLDTDATLTTNAGDSVTTVAPEEVLVWGAVAELKGKMAESLRGQARSDMLRDAGVASRRYHMVLAGEGIEPQHIESQVVRRVAVVD